MTMNEWKEKANNKLGGSPWKSQGDPQTITDYQCHVRGLFSNQPLQPSRGTQPHGRAVFEELYQFSIFCHPHMTCCLCHERRQNTSHKTYPFKGCIQQTSANSKILLPGMNVFMHYGPTVFKKIFHIQGWHFSWHWKFVTETALVWSIDCSRGIKWIWGASFLFAALSRAKLQHVQCEVWRLFCIASRSGLVNFLSTFPAWLTLLLFSACGMTRCCQPIWKMCCRQSRRGVSRQNSEKCKTIVVSQTLLHTDAFTHKSLYTQKLLHTEAFTQTLLHTKLLPTEAFTYRSFYIQKLLHTDAFTQILLHTDTFTHRHFYTQTLLHRGAAFTHKRLWQRIVIEFVPSGSSRIFLPYPNFDTDCSLEDLC